MEQTMNSKHLKLYTETDINTYLQQVEDYWIQSHPEKLKDLEKLVFRKDLRFPLEGKEAKIGIYLLESNNTNSHYGKLSSFYSRKNTLPYLYSDQFMELLLAYHYYLNTPFKYIYQPEYCIDLRKIHDLEGRIQTQLENDFNRLLRDRLFGLLEDCYSKLEDTFLLFGESLIQYDLSTKYLKLYESLNIYKNYIEKVVEDEE